MGRDGCAHPRLGVGGTFLDSGAGARPSSGPGALMLSGNARNPLFMPVIDVSDPEARQMNGPPWIPRQRSEAFSLYECF
jgi:hypothetical protein